MINAFVHHEDIHKQAASKVLGIPIEEVTKEQRSSAKAVNFGIVYGISDYGLSEQLGIPVKEAKQYIQQYLEKYAGIKQFMDDIVEKAKEQKWRRTDEKAKNPAGRRGDRSVHHHHTDLPGQSSARLFQPHQ